MSTAQLSGFLWFVIGPRDRVNVQVSFSGLVLATSAECVITIAHQDPAGGNPITDGTISSLSPPPGSEVIVKPDIPGGAEVGVSVAFKGQPALPNDDANFDPGPLAKKIGNYTTTYPIPYFVAGFAVATVEVSVVQPDTVTCGILSTQIASVQQDIKQLEAFLADPPPHTPLQDIKSAKTNLMNDKQKLTDLESQYQQQC